MGVVGLAELLFLYNKNWLIVPVNTKGETVMEMEQELINALSAAGYAGYGGATAAILWIIIHTWRFTQFIVNLHKKGQHFYDFGADVRSAIFGRFFIKKPFILLIVCLIIIVVSKMQW